MMKAQRLLIFVGSPRKKGTSYSFSQTIKALAEESGHNAEIVYVIDYFDGKQSFDDLKSIVSQSHVIGLVTPLYVDTLPYPVIWFMEQPATNLRNELKGKSLFAIGQCGFPDVTLCGSLLESCRYFAESAQMSWLGGLSYGGGPIINGAPLESLGGKGRRISSALKLALEDVLDGKTISSRAQQLIAERIPKALYFPLAVFLNYRARKTARSLGTDLTRKAYLE
ncbi:MAG: hypothetical protein HPY55_10430 [Firmicutes bacterium]|nr:hypothetical protein [Bacillota bacterium]